MKHWNWRQRTVAEIVWPSFLAACLGTAIFFAGIDPSVLQLTTVFSFELSHTGIYTCGFFFFWLVAGTASGLSVWLVRTERPRDQFPPLDENP